MFDAKNRSTIRWSRAFTQIELLVVIGIIGILIAVLMPVLGKVRGAAVGTQCLANQSQLVSAVHNYAVEHKGNIPYDTTSAGSADVYYVITGMTTTQISLETGEPVAAGLLVEEYLGNTPEVLFCPGDDNGLNGKDEVAKVGNELAISGYIYRHGSNTYIEQLEAAFFGGRLDRHTRLDKLGDNSRGAAISALFADNNFRTSFTTLNRSSHEGKFSNIAYADGHAEQRDNASGDYTADVVGKSITASLYALREVLENADAPQ